MRLGRRKRLLEVPEMSKALNALLTFVIAVVLLLQAVTTHDLVNRVNDLEDRLSTTQDQLLTLSKDQKRLSEAVLTWLESWQLDMFESSAYSPLDDRNGLSSWGDGEYMAAGVKTRDHLDTAIAVDPDVVPLGSRVFIIGFGWRKALDTGGAIRGNKIDICMRSYEQAINYGRQKVLVMWPRKEVIHKND
jgi:3D (Asp-Asp-Asp) domain-containing protein